MLHFFSLDFVKEKHIRRVLEKIYLQILKVLT